MGVLGPRVRPAGGMGPTRRLLQGPSRPRSFCGLAWCVRFHRVKLPAGVLCVCLCLLVFNN